MFRTSVCSAALAATLATAAVTSARADDFLQQQGDMWRASKLVGVNIYGPDKKKVGDISDLLMGKDGKVSYVVVGVGGFLGLGEKNVAIPFDKVTFTQEPLTPPAVNAAPAGNMTAPAGAPANNAMAPGAGLGTPATTNGAGTGSTPMAGNTAAPNAPGAAALPAAPTSYPDHGTIDYNADQLKAAPTFTFAR